MPSDEQRVRADVQRNREVVLNSAIGVLAGNPDASMREIAEASGLGRTTVYRHFPSREELVRAIFAQVNDEAIRRFKASLDTGGTAAESLKRIGPMVAELAAEYRFLDAHRHLDLPPDGREGQADPLREWIRQAHARGELTQRFTPEWQYRMIGAMARGASDELVAGRTSVDETGEVLGQMLADLFAADA